MQLSRRALLAGASLAGASLAAAPIPAWARSFSQGQFTHGIASGDPLSRAIILWTRFQPSAGDGRIGWEISEDESFRRVARRGRAEARAANDYCVKVDARGLQPGRAYFYRFLSGSGPSVTGRTRTAPEGAAASLSAAFFSCSNLPYGYFHAYGDAAAREDIELALHLGDYMYEGPRGMYPSAQDAVPGRMIEPIGETVRLADYYQRYASYHADPDLQELRRLKPLSAVWDDHEITNDTYKDGAQNHQEGTEGTWADRVAAASKAYFDWMPIRRAATTSIAINRMLDWGDLARIVLMDTRYVGRDKQLNYQTDLLPQVMAPGADMRAAVERFQRDQLNNPARTLLGADQESWMARALGDSKRRGQTWQVLAQQLVVGEQRAPAGITRLLPPSASSNNWYAMAERVAQLGLPWNLDAWDGYPAARARLLDACATHGANALIIGGDSHNTWVNNLEASGGGRLAAIEFAGGSVTSPGFERALTEAQPGEREAMMKSANPHMAFLDLTNRGYGYFKLTREACEAEWRAVSDVKTQARGPVSATKLTSAASATAGPGAWSVSA